MARLGTQNTGGSGAKPWSLALLGFVLVTTSFLLSGPGLGSAAAQTDDAADTEETGTEEAETADQAAQDELLRDGAAVYSQVCQACHQPGGVGLPGSYPPLLDNPAVDDAAYVVSVINNGKQGELVVNGETYNGVMPSFSTLPEDDVEALIAYIQSGFQAPSGPAPEATGPVAGTELPALADMGWQAGFLIAALIFLLVIGPRLTSRIDRLNTPWFDAWLKTATIVVAVVLAVAYIPNWVMQTSVVADLARPLQDLIGVTVWGLGLALCLGGLWYAHRDQRL
jgi:mono/diheme cytochrome c family protein